MLSLRPGFTLLFAALVGASCANDIVSPGGGGSGGTVGTSSVTVATSGTSTASSSTTAVSSASSSSSSSGAGGGGDADILDPNEVYLSGTMQEGACDKNALAHWSTPDQAIVGFDCYFEGGTIRPTDGRLIYKNTFENDVREFHCDGACLFNGTYPATPLANDPELALLPACGNTLTVYLVAPDGTVLHRCPSAQGEWYDEAGNVVWADPYHFLQHLGYDGLAMTDDDKIVDLATSSSTPLTGLPRMATIHGMRALPTGGFWLLVQANEELGGYALWQAGADGVATVVGTFPSVPTGITVFTAGAPPQLDASGAVFDIGTRTATGEDVIVRRDLSGTSALVYDEATDPLVKVHISTLVTGP